MKTPPPTADVWLDERLVVGDSVIEGRGLFFSTDTVAGTIVIELGGRLVWTAELEILIAAADADPQAPFVDTVTIYPDQHLVLPPGTPVHFGNHSCDPSLWHIGPYSLGTRRDVAAGEEATIDYGTQSGAPGFRMICTCGTPTCRGVVTSDDWQDGKLQRRYEGHWVPALQARIHSRQVARRSPDRGDQCRLSGVDESRAVTEVHDLGLERLQAADRIDGG